MAPFDGAFVFIFLCLVLESFAIKHLQASEFDRVVMDPKVDVLVQFHMPSSEACGKFAEIYADLEAISKEDSSALQGLLFTAVDVSPDVSPILAETFKEVPTLMLFPKAHKSGMVYTGKLQREELVAWMAKKLDHGAPDEQQTEAPNSGKDKNEATDDGKDEL
jgi:hypothetical protein